MTQTSTRRLLFLVPFPPNAEAAHGGARVTAQLMARLAARHRVALVYLRAPADLSVDSTVQERCERVEAIPRPDPGIRLRAVWSRAGALARGLPMWAAGCAIGAYRTRLRELVKTWHPDIVQIEYTVMTQYLSALEGCPAPRVLVPHEPSEKAARDLLNTCGGIRRVRYWADWLAWRRFEHKVVKQVQAVVVFTERDRAELARLGSSTPVVRIPFGTAVPARSADPLGSSPLTLLFVGSFRHPPNVDAAVRLATRIFPRVESRYPDARLYIVGEQPPRSVLRLAKKNITVTGRVPDVAPYLDAAAIVVAPLRIGGGMRVKVLEALAAGKCLVASPLAVEGLDVLDGDHILLADTDQQFSSCIVELLNDPQQRRVLAERAREWACAHLSWENTIRAYEDMYDQLLGTSRMIATEPVHSSDAVLSGVL